MSQVVRIPFVVERNYAGWRLDEYLRQKLRRLAPERIPQLIAERLETASGERVTPETLVTPGFAFSLLKDAEPEPETPLDFGVVHEDGMLLVVDKPAGLPIHPTARYFLHTFTTVARQRYPDHKIDPAHRLDRETSGLLACGMAPEWTRALKRSFADGRVSKTYLALVAGWPAEDRFEVDVPIGLTLQSAVRVRMHAHPAGQPSRTCFEVIERRIAPDGTRIALVACEPRTGRQHQIRAHLLVSGTPIVGDKIYGPDELIFDRFTKRAMTDADHVALQLPRQALHAWKLAFPHPATREQVAFECPLAPDLAAFWEACAP